MAANSSENQQRTLMWKHHDVTTNINGSVTTTTTDVTFVLKRGTTFTLIVASQIDEDAISFWGTPYKRDQLKSIDVTTFYNGAPVRMREVPRFITEVSVKTLSTFSSSTLSALMNTSLVESDSEEAGSVPVMCPQTLAEEEDEDGDIRVVFTYNNEVYIIESEHIMHMRGSVREDVTVSSDYLTFFRSCIKCNVSLAYLEVAHIVEKFA